MVLALVRMPPYLRLAVNLGKAQKAIAAHKYITAENTLKSIVKEFPALQEPKAYLLIAACYNMHYDVALKTDNELRNFLNVFEDTQDETENAVRYLSVALAEDSTIRDRIALASADSVAGLMKLLKEVDSTTDDNRLSSKYLIADKLYDMERYEECKRELSNIIKEKPEHYFALSLMAATNRHLKHFDEAIANCDAILEVNREETGAMLQKAKVELARKDSKKAAVYLAQAKAIDPIDITVMEVQTLIAHFEGKNEEANKLLVQMKVQEDDSDKVVYNRTANILNGKEIFN